MNKYVDRLVKEWEQYGSIIIGVDFYSTLKVWPNFDNQDDINRVIEVLKVAQETGAKIIILNEYVGPLGQIDEYMKELDINDYRINSPIHLGGSGTFSDGKIYCNVYLDDRAGLSETLNILERATYTIRSKRASRLSKDGVA